MRSPTPTRTEPTGSSKKAIVAVLGLTRHYTECLTQSLASRKGFTVMNLGPYEPADLDRLAHIKPHAVLLDLLGTRPIPLIRRLGRTLPNAALVALNGGEDESQVIAFFEAGLTGFVPKNASLDDLDEILRRVLRHELYCPPGITEAMVRRLRESGGGRGTAVRSDHLSAREVTVLGLVEQGLTNKEIARRLGIEPATVKNHVHRILEKLSVHRRGDAASSLRHPELQVVKGEKPVE